MHPLLPDPSGLTDEELITKINEIYKRMDFFSKTGNNEAYRQSSIIYQDLVDHHQERMFRAQQAAVEAAESGETHFTDKIDISK